MFTHTHTNRHLHTKTQSHTRTRQERMHERESEVYCEVVNVTPDPCRNVEGGLTESEVSFMYVRARPPCIVLLVEDTNVMNVQVSLCTLV